MPAGLWRWASAIGWRCGVVIVAAFLLGAVAAPWAGAAGLVGGAHDCRAAADAASRAAALPQGLLAAIGVVESGRAGIVGGVRSAWPDTVDADGVGHWFATAGEAADFVRMALAGGARSVDVGCFQIDLQDHPGAFSSLRAAFDPDVNARYAAGFLARLRARTGSWAAAIADYHSAIPARGAPYAALVRAAWHGSVGGDAVAVTPDAYVIHIAPTRGRLPVIVTP
ncbi:MAG: lytic transglycosylase domain-containing protein [Acidocella sp.]|nr:lytic transglycosylase domain-containing protein [Acidocella sp.]